MSWPPTDAESLLGRWRERGSPEISLGPGESISNLERWLYPLHPHWPEPTWQVDQVRGELEFLDGLLLDAAPEEEELPEEEPEPTGGQERLF